MRANRSVIVFFSFIVLSISVLGYFLEDYLSYKKEINIQRQLDDKLATLFERVQSIKKIIQTASLILSNSEEIKECLKSSNKSKCDLYLNSIQKDFKSVEYLKDVDIHLHTKNLESFFRVWDINDNSFEDLSKFRNSLLDVKKGNTIIGNEIGKYSLKIRAISPIFDNNEYIGSVELISDFEEITKYYKSDGIDFFVLMKKEKILKNSLIDYKDKKEFRDFVIINDVNSNLKIFKDVKLENTSYVKKSGYYLLYTPIYSISREEIGFYALKIPDLNLFN